MMYFWAKRGKFCRDSLLLSRKI